MSNNFCERCGRVTDWKMMCSNHHKDLSPDVAALTAEIKRLDAAREADRACIAAMCGEKNALTPPVRFGAVAP